MMTTWVFAGAFLSFVMLAALCDLSSLRIPNRLTATMAASGPVAVWLLGAGLPAIPGTLMTGAIVLAISWAMFELGWFGGGDAKLATAISLWLGPDATLIFVFATTLFGAVLAAALLILCRWQGARSVVGSRWNERIQAKNVSVPYAVAMAPAGLVALCTSLSDLV